MLDGCTRWLHNRGVRFPPVFVLLASLSGCVVDAVPAVPLQGPPPELVLVLQPAVAPGIPVPDPWAFAAGADRALRARGVRALPPDVARDLLRQSDCSALDPDAPSLLRLRQQTNVDAVLAISVERWRATGVPLAAADWKWTWTLRSTRNGNSVWTWTDAGSWRREAASHQEILRAPDAEPEVKPFGSTAAVSFAQEAELIEALHRKAMQRLARGGG